MQLCVWGWSSGQSAGETQKVCAGAPHFVPAPVRLPPGASAAAFHPDLVPNSGGWALALSAPWGWVQDVTFLAPFKGFVTTKLCGERFVSLKVSVGS